MIQMSSFILVVLLLWVLAWHLPSVKGRQILLLFASYLFYSNWGVSFLAALIVSSLMNYICGSALRRKVTTPRLWIGIAVNLLPLAFFKYLPPLLESGPAGLWQYDLARQIIMPVGMSFWTFQGLSYLFDIYLEETLDPSLLEFCLYMAFWPTVVSGPVCRLPNMLPQFRQLSPISWENVSAGSLRFIQGLTMKFVLAQILGSGWTPGEGIAAGFDQDAAETRQKMAVLRGGRQAERVDGKAPLLRSDRGVSAFKGAGQPFIAAAQIENEGVGLIFLQVGHEEIE